MFLHQTAQDIRAIRAKQVAEAAIGIGEDRHVKKSGRIFKGREFHRFAVFGLGEFFRDQPSHHGDLSTGVHGHVASRNVAQAAQVRTMQIERMAAPHKAECVHFMSQPVSFRILIRNGKRSSGA